MSKILKTASYSIEFSSLLDATFESFLLENYAEAKKAILVDENTNEYCLAHLITNFACLKNAEIIVIPAGEENKVFEIAMQVLETLTEYQFSRKDLLINLGGGVVSDMGGFLASIYKRGIDFINVPTSLLAMVDASVGGKTGIDLGPYKNQIGLFSNPKAIFIDENFLQTLSKVELISGKAEMLKHALIADKNHWEDLKIKEISSELLFNSVKIKLDIVEKDPFEKGERKKLNFGHTIGHAIEGHFLGTSKQLPHGHAIALGMICEAYISFVKKLITKSELEEIVAVIRKDFELIKLDENDFTLLFNLAKNDKKNEKNQILAVLLVGIGAAIVDQILTEQDFAEALYYLNSLSIKGN